MKTTTRLTIATLALCASAGTLAQATPGLGVQVYGVMDACVVSYKAANAPRWYANGGGCYYGSRLGFRGAEDLGGGMRAYFVLEGGMSIDSGALTQGGRAWGRRSLVGLSGGLGSLEAGREYAPAFYLINTVDPMRTGIGSALTTLWSGSASAGVGRTDNSLTYQTPSLGGVTVRAIAGVGEQAAPLASRGKDTRGLSVTYRGDKLYASVSYGQVSNSDDTGDDSAVTLGLKYDFGSLSVAGIAQSGAWKGSRTEAAPSSPTSMFSRQYASYLLGATWKFAGGHNLAGTYRRYDDRTAPNYDADAWSLVYVHVLSKRTQLYAGATRLHNIRGSSYNTSDGNGAYTGAAPGGSSRAADVGITHFF
ncbi:MAG: porin [Rhizobacter sp.]|nr:porin [Rhizobacter sp.]